MTGPLPSAFEVAKNLFLRGLDAHAAGSLEAAEQAYREALALMPDRPSVLGNLGALLMQTRRIEEAEPLLRRKLQIENGAVESLLALGECLMALGKHAEALPLFDRALAAEPRNAIALFNRGNIFFEQGNAAAAVECYEKLLLILPDHLDALNNLVGALASLGRHNDALACVEKALTIAPENPQVLCNHGSLLAELGRYPDALTRFDKVLQLNPRHFEAHCSRSGVQLKLRQYDAAAKDLRTGLSIQPNHVESLNNLARVCLVTRNPGEALTTADRALVIQPDNYEARVIRGNALLALGQPSDALADFDRALAVKPDDADVLNCRCNALLLLDAPEALVESYERLLQANPDYDYAPGCWLHAKLHCCDWRGYHEAVQRVIDGTRSGKRADLPFTFLAVSGSAKDQLQCARLHAAREYPAPAQAQWKGDTYKHDKIRVAYLSADFHEHATAYLMAGLFEAHDKSRFDITAISFGPDTGDAMRGRLQSAFLRFVDVRNNSDHEVAALLRELEIDIAVDLKGYTQHHRAGILAYRAAPIQVNYLGYPGTMGADFIDYIIADAAVIPPEDRIHYSEKVVYLPDTYQVNDSRRVISERTITRAEAGLPEHGVVFCCFNNPYKITPDMFDIWMRILTKVEGSVLWLLAGHEVMARNLRAEAERRGVAPYRLIFAPRMPLREHLARHRLADIFLDTLPYNAHTTASDALWAGLPVVTCAGKTFPGRVAASLLGAAGMTELISPTLLQYEALAVTLATNDSQLAEMKSRLRSRRATCALFNTDRYRRHLEAAYQTMWDRYRGGTVPEGFAVSALK